MSGAKRGKRVSAAEFARLWGDTSLSITEIGRRLSITGNAVRCRALRRGLPPRTSGRPATRKHDHDAFVRLYRAGLTMRAIADLHRCSEHTVLWALRRAGEPSRSRHDPASIGDPSPFILAALARETKAALVNSEMVDRPRTSSGRKAA